MDNLRGITFDKWRQLLRENRFAVDPAYLGRAKDVTILSIINGRMKRREDAQFGAQIEAASIQPPVFILGHWRNGTTLLHELFALDEQFAYPNLFQVSNPHTFLLREAEIAHHLEGMSAQSRPMDNMLVTFRSPGEDEAALSVSSLRSPVIAWAFPRREAFYDRYYTFREASQAEIEEWKAALVWFFKKLSWKYNRPLVLKSPPHTARIRLLLELFPDARFIHIQRDPFAVFRSTQQLYSRAVPLSNLQRPDPAQVDEGIIRRYADIYQAYFEQRDLVPARQFCDVRFEDLEHDIVGQMAAIYEQLGLSGFAQVEPKLRQYVESRADYQKNRHQPLPDPVRNRLAQAWNNVFTAWGYAV